MKISLAQVEYGKFIRANRLRLALFGALVLGVGAFFVSGGHNLLSFGQLVAHKDQIVSQAAEHPFEAALAFLGAYLVLGLFGLPGNTVLYLAAGLLFGFANGLVLVLVGSTLASSLAFLSFRYLFGDFVEKWVKRRFPKLEKELARDDAFVVFSTRVLPVLPYSSANLILAVSPVRFAWYVAMTLVGLMPRYLLYVHAGTDLSALKDPNDLFSTSLVGALLLLAVLPWIFKWLFGKIKA
jgi:uncharacterized membrane protein YdjX (TVP38/TMEM64 family)